METPCAHSDPAVVVEPDPAHDRPEILQIPGLLTHAKMLTVFSGLVYVPLQALWPAIAPPLAVAEALLWVIGAAIAWGLSDHRLSLSESATYRPLGTRLTAAGLRVMWWRCLFLAAWLPGWLWLLAARAAALTSGAPPATGWAAAEGAVAVFIPAVGLLSLLLDRQASFLHPSGIQSSKTYLHPWRRIVGIRHQGADLVIDLDTVRSHPPGHLIVTDEVAREALFTAARVHAIPLSEGLPPMVIGKLAALALAASLTAMVPLLLHLGLRWTWATGLLLTLALGATLLEERLTGVATLAKNPLRPRPAGRLDQVGFTRRWQEALLAGAPGTEVEECGPLRLRSRPHPEAAWGEHRLDNAWAAYERDPSRLDTIIAEFVGGSQEALTLGPVDPARVVPAIRHRGMLVEMRDNGVEPLFRDLAGDLVAVLVEDHPRTLRYVAKTDLGLLGADETAAWERALGNLDVIATERQVRGSDGLYFIEAPFHAGALLLDRTWLTPLRFPVEGDLVVAVPGRDLAIVTGTAQELALKALPELLRTAAAEIGPQASGEVFRVYPDGRWELFQPR